MRRIGVRLAALLLALLLLPALGACVSPGGQHAPKQGSLPQVPDAPMQLIAIAHTRGEDSAVQQSLLAADAWLREQSEGRLGLDIYADGQLGADAELLSLVYAGLLQIALPRAATWAEIAADPDIDTERWPQLNSGWLAAAVYDLPWLYADAASAVAAAQALHEATAPYLQHGMLRLGYFSADSLAMVNNKRQISSAADVAGLSFATAHTDRDLAVNQRLGAASREYRHYAIITALAEGKVDAAAAPLAEIAGQGWPEHAPWLLISGRGYEICAVTANQQWYHDLDTADRELVDAALEQFLSNLDWLSAVQQQSLLDQLAAAGAAISRADAALIADFRSYMQPIYSDYSRDYADLFAIAGSMAAEL